MKTILYVILAIICFGSICYGMDANIKGYVVSIPYDNKYVSIRTTDNNLIHVKVPSMNTLSVGQEIEIRLIIKMLEDARGVGVVFMVVGAEIIDEQTQKNGLTLK